MPKVIKTKAGPRCVSKVDGHPLPNASCSIPTKESKAAKAKPKTAKSPRKAKRGGGKGCPSGQIKIHAYKVPSYDVPSDGSPSFCRKAPKKRGKK